MRTFIARTSLLLLATSAAPVHAEAVWLAARLSGVYQPSGGDSDGAGTFVMEVDRDKGQFCYTLTTRRIGISRVDAALHRGGSWTTGPAELLLDVTGNGNETCTRAAGDLLGRLLARPDEFYINVRNGQFPQGALRGALERR